jgi:AraC-like DNA-binding protein
MHAQSLLRGSMVAVNARSLVRSEMSETVVSAIVDAMTDFLASHPIRRGSSERRALLERFHHELALGAGWLPPGAGARRAPGHPVDSAVVNRAVALVAEELDLGGIGVELGKRVPWGGLGFLDTLTFASETLGAALGQVVKHYGALTSTVSMRLDPPRTSSSRGAFGRELVTLVQEQKNDEDDVSHLVDFAFAFCVARARAAVTGSFQIEAVRLRRAASRTAAVAHRAFFGVEPEYGASENALVFDATALAMALRNPNPMLVEVIDANAEHFVSASREGLAPRLGVLVSKHLDRRGEVLGVDAAAKAMGLSGRTLQTRLAEAGTTFADLVDGVRRDKALRLVQRGATPLTTIAFSLGFRSSASFSRAFRRWTGTSPSGARRRAAPASRAVTPFTGGAGT